MKRRFIIELMLAFSAVGTIAISSASEQVVKEVDKQETPTGRAIVKEMSVGTGYRYSGETLNGKPDGYGTLFRPDGSILLTGEFVNGLPNGNATGYWSNGQCRTEGSWVNGEFVDAKLYDNTGQPIFDGHWIRTPQNTFELNGYGTEYREGGKIKRQGQWVNGIFVRGKLYSPLDGRVYYDGDVSIDGKRHGHGTSFDWAPDKNIKSYYGNWYNDRRQGHGTSYRADGTLDYIGEWANDEKSGQGVQYFPLEKSRPRGYTAEYDGQWSHGQANGVGVRFFRSGRPSTVGTWHDGVATGEVIEYYDDEKHTVKFKGKLKDEQPNGHCEMYWDNGRLAYSGTMKDGMPNGQCEIYWDNGRLAYSGSWVGTVREGGSTTIQRKMVSK